MTILFIAFHESYLSTNLIYLQIFHEYFFEVLPIQIRIIWETGSGSESKSRAGYGSGYASDKISGAVEAQNRAIAYGEPWTLTREEWSSK
jgi:hypothetical protein